MSTDLESRIRRLEDRALISERVIRYAMGVDASRLAAVFAECFTDPVHADFSASGVPAADFARDNLVEMVRVPLSGFTATQHLSPNHVIEFDEHDPDRASVTPTIGGAALRRVSVRRSGVCRPRRSASPALVTEGAPSGQSSRG